MRGRPCAAGFHQSWMSFSVTNSRIAFQIRFWHFRHNKNTKSDSDRWSYRPVNCICTKKYTVHRGSCRFSAGVEASVTWHTGFSQWRPLFVDSRRQIARSQNRRRMCEIRLTKLSCAAQQVGIVHFYAVTDIKGLSCPLWWMREWRNLLTSTHVGYRSVIRAVASGASLKFGVQGASATNWLSRVNGARDNGIRLYCVWNQCTFILKVEHTGMSSLRKGVACEQPISYRQITNIKHTLVCNYIVDHSDVDGASPVGPAPTKSSFSTSNLDSMYCPKATASQDEKHLSFGI